MGAVLKIKSHIKEIGIMGNKMSIEQKIIDMYWEKNRDQMLLKEELIKYLKTTYGADLKSNSYKKVAVSEMKKLLTPDTLADFSENLDRFGLVKNDVTTLLHIGDKKVQKLIADGVIRRNGTYVSTSSGRFEYHICNIADLITYYNKNIKEEA
jgi:hypothetical protein